MLQSQHSEVDQSRKILMGRRLLAPLAIVLLQLVAAFYFVADGIDELLDQAANGMSFGVIMECLVAVALLAGVTLGIVYLLRTQRQLRLKERALASAQGALGEHIAIRFGEWGLTASEADVALFALKGCDAADIARLRGAAMGTVRSQLSQVYAKAGVSSQAALVSLFFEDLLDWPASIADRAA